MRALTLALIAVAIAALPAPALAKKGQLSVFQSDGLLRDSTPETRAQTLDELDWLGVDIVKTIVSWRNVAPAGKSNPHGVDGRNPASYPPGAWDPYDDFARQARARGIQVLFVLGGKAPQWAAAGTKRHPGSKRPNPLEFRHFVEAAGTRYSGGYLGLPRVTRWAVWNEPNLANWLAPMRRRGVPFAPHHYRKLVNNAHIGLRRSGHRRDQLLIGELVPYGANRHRMRPIHFLREMACVNNRYRPFRGRAARKRGCHKFRRLPGTGLSIHPYTPAGGPNVRMRHRDDAPIAYLSRVAKALDRLYRKKRLRKRKMPIWNTEFGFQTDPPDIFQTPIRKVPRFMGKSEWLSWYKPRVASHAHYLLRDEAMSGGGFARYSGWQSGLRFANGKAKRKVYKAYRLPFFVRLRGRRAVEVWGGVRARGRGAKVRIQSRLPRRKWRNVRTARTQKRGYFRKTFRIAHRKKRLYRFRVRGGTSIPLRAGR